jgi:membrane-bound metal-dependent hydrolase YbcI (DUF457 family)
MPFAFPSHQGLIAPLWRRWPAAFDVPALCVGAGMPDTVDATRIFWYGHFGQGLGHSLVGLMFLGIPAGLVLWFVLHAAARRLWFLSGFGFWGRAWNLGLAAFRTGIKPADFSRKWRRVLWCLGAGGFSHLCFDLVSHGGFPWLMPWVPKIRIFPAWWYATWARIPVPGYEEPYALGPYLTVWLFLSFLGIYMLIRPAFAPPVESKTKEERTAPQ